MQVIINNWFFSVPLATLQVTSSNI